MARRHQLAIVATETNNPLELCQLLTEAVKDATDEQVAFHKDPACRLIAMHIAFACNGDMTFLNYYSDVYDYCMSIVERDAVGVPLSSEPPVQPEAPEQ